MNPKNAPPPPPAMLTPNEIYYILSRHKWLIILVTSVALIAAGLVRFFWPLRYESNAALMIKYIKTVRPPVQNGGDAQVTPLSSGQEDIINSELTILTSYDLATNVVGILTPARILAKEGKGTNKIEAATLIQKNLKPSVLARSDVIELSFSHRDSDMASLILNQIIEAYLKRHNEIHRPEVNDFLTREIETKKGALQETDDQLREAKARAKILDIGDKNAVSGMLYKTQQEIYDAQADLQSHLIAIRELESMVPKAAAAPATNTAAQTASEPEHVPPADLAAYQKICARLAKLKMEQQGLLDVYTPTSSLVLINEGQIATNEAAKRELETKYRTLVAMRPVETQGANASMVDPMQRLNEEKMKANEVAGRINILTSQLAEVRTNAASISAMEGTIMELERQRQQQEAALDFYSQKLDESNAGAVFAEGNSNISIMESPTPAVRDESKLNKWAAEIVVFGLFVAFGLPFLIELVFDRSIKHPGDIKARLGGLPFFICIPQLPTNGKTRALKPARTAGLLPDASNDPAAPAPGGLPATLTNGHLALWEEIHALQPFYETLRDRLMTFFEMINLTHKPKLVAVTSCAAGAGVTTTAAGLASSLSETGDGNVLLVNMNVRDGEAHHFYKGKLTCGLDEVLEKNTRETAYVEGNLYVAKEQPEDDRLPRVLPKRFSHLLPKMKASDFDYIIFDMPPVNQISITPRLARFMDMVLLVVESEKTDRDAAQRVATLLTDSKANVGIVLNKNKAYLPKSREQDI